MGAPPHCCYHPDDVAVAVAVCNSPARLGLRVPSHADSPIGDVLRTGHAVRVDSFTGTSLAGLGGNSG